ncbi:hypothetical protein [Marinicellulosiphila megalodicopiae]|uniref:hypothetical protein n=1 Tax=Marinicellulosiphila megalodicopiae TaxID=2724896 RepID=UPI003BB1A7EA
MSNRDLTQEEIDRLDRLKRDNKVRLVKMGAMLISLSAFCMATLSAQNIPSSINFILTVVVLIIFIVVLLFTKYRNNPLQKALKELYPQCKDNQSAKKHLDEVNDWVGFGEKKRELWLPVLIAVLFVAYALFDHGICVLS